MNKLNRSAATLATASVLMMLLAFPAHATLIGDSVVFSHDYMGSPLGSDGAVAVVGDGVEFREDIVTSHFFNVDVGASSILFFVDSDTAPGGEIGFRGPIQGYGVLDLDWTSVQSEIIDVIITNSGVRNLAIDPVSFTADSVRLEVGGSVWTDNIDFIRVDLITRSAPEPPPLFILAFGLVGLALTRRKGLGAPTLAM